MRAGDGSPEHLFECARNPSRRNLESLLGWLSHSDASVRRLAAELLLLAAPGRFELEVLELLRDDTEAVRYAASHALAWHGGARLAAAAKDRMCDAADPAPFRYLLDVLCEPGQRVPLLRQNEISRLVPPQFGAAALAVIGPSGSGKTTCAETAARHLGLNFIDTDRWVERMLGLPTFEIFRLEGENAFRVAETTAVVEATRASGALVAIGAGAVSNRATRQAIRRFRTVIWLDVSRAVAIARLTKPEEPSNAVGEFYRMHGVASNHATVVEKFRRPFYEELADTTIHTDGLGVSAVVGELVTAVAAHQGAGAR